MMNNVIFGSGIVGLMAKRILSGNWQIIPFSRSRYYSFNPPLADNFIIRDADIDQPIRELTGDDRSAFYRRCYSVGGALISQHDNGVASDWLSKIFGNDVPQHSLAYLTKRMTVPVYNIRTNVLYQSLQNQYVDELKSEAAKGPITEIGQHYFIRGGVRTDFENAVSTIP